MKGKQTVVGYRVVIISYDLANRLQADLQKANFGVVVADESHYLKSSFAKRTQVNQYYLLRERIYFRLHVVWMVPSSSLRAFLSWRDYNPGCDTTLKGCQMCHSTFRHSGCVTAKGALHANFCAAPGSVHWLPQVCCKILRRHTVKVHVLENKNIVRLNFSERKVIIFIYIHIC